MQKHLFNFSLIVSAALFLSACTQGPTDPITGQSMSLSSISNQKFKAGGYELIIGPDIPLKDVSNLTESELKNIFINLDNNLCNASFTYEKCVQNFTQAQKKQISNGVSGIAGQAFLRTAQSDKNPNGKRVVNVKGQILDFCLHDPNLAGYEYDDQTNKLRLCVIMETKISKPQNSNNKIRFQYFHVEAKNARVDQRGNDTDNIFPVAASATGLKIEGTADNASLNFKLYAEGKDIEIVNYWEANAKSKNSKTKWKQYDKTTGAPQRIKKYFVTDDDACVDMMFPGAVPPILGPGAAAGVHYCLGRCKNPPIVNTR